MNADSKVESVSATANVTITMIAAGITTAAPMKMRLRHAYKDVKQEFTHAIHWQTSDATKDCEWAWSFRNMHHQVRQHHSKAHTV